MENFLITAMGRSGTKFLANTMNRSKAWTVNHEYPNEDLRLDVQDIQKRFEQNRYGEVNSNLRFVIDFLDVAKKGLILRDPVDTWISIANRRNPGQWNNALKKMIEGMEALALLALRSEYLSIPFSKMVSDKIYLDAVFRYFGIFDVKLTDEILETPINATQNKRYFELKEFDSAIQEPVLELRDKIKRLF